MGAATGPKSIHLRTAFISDVHLGTRGCRADLLLEFLKPVHVETLVFIGDIHAVCRAGRGVSGYLHGDVATAVTGVLELDRQECRRYALGFTWKRATREFESNLAPRAYAQLAGRTDVAP